MKVSNQYRPMLSPAERKQLEALGEGLEGHFSKFLIQEMRKSVPKSEKVSSAEGFYQDQLDGLYAEQMAKSGSGLGIKDLIIEQFGSKARRPQLNMEQRYEQD